MRSSTQISADVPPVMMPQIHKNMPMRAPRSSATNSPRNLTGVYLGKEKMQEYPIGSSIPRHSVPPFMKGKGFWKRVRTPTEERRHQKVELLRDREERRGFCGRPPKRRNLCTPEHTSISPLSWKENQQPAAAAPSGGQDVDVLDLTRQTNRFFTAVNNTGVVRLEYLNPPVYDNTTLLYDGDGHQGPLQDTVKAEIQRLALDRADLLGIEECYKKVCKGNVNVMHTLLPQRRGVESRKDGDQTALHYTGFTVKSYRNPAQAEIIAHFPEPHPRTTHHARGSHPQPCSPYFFKVYNPPKTAAVHMKNGHPYPEDVLGGEAVLARNSTPVFVGASSANLKGKPYHLASLGQGNHVLPDFSSPFVSPRKENPLASPRSPSLTKSADKYSLTSERSKVEISVPHAPQVAEAQANHTTAEQENISTETTTQSGATQQNQSELTKTQTDQSGQRTSETDQSNVREGDALIECKDRVDHITSDQGTADQQDMMPKITSSQSNGGAVILIGVEDESGEQMPVEIDEADDILQKETEKVTEDTTIDEPGPIRARKKSITERVNKSRESEKALNELREKAECRQKEFASLLNEHAQIVKEIDYDSDEKGSSEDKENSSVPANAT